MNNPRLIGLWSPAPRSGKTTVAEYLVRKHNYVRVPFAQPLKRMVRTILAEYGYNAEEISDFENGDKTETPFNFSPVTIRQLYQTLGTEWGRMEVHPDLWVHLWFRTVSKMMYLSPKQGIVVDDVRFENEVEFVRKLDGIMWKVRRPGFSTRITHASEALRESEHHFNNVFVNDGSLANLYTLIDKELESCKSASN